MSNYPGSWATNCDPNGPQLIIENRAVLLEYARDRAAAGDFGGGSKERGFGSSGGVSHGQSDWLCSACSCHNFARREQCFRCSAPRPADGDIPFSANPANVNNPSSSISLIASDTPTAYLVVRGFNQQTVREEHLTELLRQFAVVKQTFLLPAGDPTTHYSTGMAFVQFHTVDHAAYTLKCLQDGGGLFIDQNQLQVHFAKEAMMMQLIQHQSHPLFVASAAANLPALTATPMPPGTSTTASSLSLPPSSTTSNAQSAAAAAAAALQAAQWSMNNAYAAANPPANMLQASIQPPPPLYPHLPVASNYPAKPKKSKWPPTFESSGSSYVFQARSGYFLEPTTNFYFCPKSKLYFDGHDGLYFKFKPTHTPDAPAVELVEPPLPCETDPTIETGSSSASIPATEKKGMVIKLNPIKLNTSTASAVAATSSSSGFSMNLSSSSSSSSTNIAAAAATTVVGGKKVLKDILKWGALQKEEEEEQEIAQREKEREKASRASHKQSKREVTHLPAAVDSAPPAVSTTVNSTAAITATVAAVPVAKAVPAVCLLCRRQFPSQEVLQRHERESKLHLDNLKQLLEKQKQST
mmetsp:Transcript_31733/g.43291  ORF Transcript_31733/g.43291 Transcript_31733/m.43291 type:complete len:582 (+) Transcript_31733:501-2246(+)